MYFNALKALKIKINFLSPSFQRTNLALNEAKWAILKGI
jgi:hypothetical protein